VTNPHLLSMGAIEMPRATFLDHVQQLTTLPAHAQAWHVGSPFAASALR
jgi:Leu/Phe-tRNA-protein transferase